MAVLAVVKIGGSFISDKSRRFHVRRRAVQDAFNSLPDRGLIIVHGGGSFGHPVASRFGLSSRTTSSSGRGVWETRDAMQKLDSIICHSMARAGLRPYVVPGVAILDLELNERPGVKEMLDTLSKTGLTPVSYGDVLPVKGGFRVVSGDYISMVVCRSVKPRRMVFVIDKPGILKDPNDESSLLAQVSPSELVSFGSNEGVDVTGGLAYKLEMARIISESGVEAAFVSGFDVDALIKSVLGKPFKGTLVVSKQ